MVRVQVIVAMKDDVAFQRGRMQPEAWLDILYLCARSDQFDALSV